MTPGGFAGWVLGNRRVYFTHRVDLMVYEISVKRRDGTVVSTRINDVEIMQSRIAPIELAQRGFSNPLDRIAVTLVAHRELWNDLAIRSFMAAGAQTRLVNTMRTWRGVSVPDVPLGESPAENEVMEDRPKPLAPPNPDPDFPIYRPR